MRLLNTTTYELQESRQGTTRPPYAILSHRWYPQEITYATLNSSGLQNDDIASPQLEKIRGTCRIARAENLEWVWIDSSNINKNSSEELNRSINSMFRWYQEAAICYTYLTDVVKSGQQPYTSQQHDPEKASKQQSSVFKRHDSNETSEWFERGWTLQELLAPRQMRFYDTNWTFMGTRSQLAPEIERITGIEAKFLDGSEAFRSASIAARLSWQARRKTTEEEDMAYSLLGIFDVDLVPTYGEGRKAFFKLQQKLLQNYRDESLFAWTAPKGRLPKHDRNWGPDQWGLLAPSIICFQNCGKFVISGKSKERPAGGITPTAEGVKFPMPASELESWRTWMGMLSVFAPPFIGPFLWHGIRVYKHKHRREWSLTLNCWTENGVGQLKPLQIFLCRDSRGDEFWRRCRCEDLEMAQKIASNSRTGTGLLKSRMRYLVVSEFEHHNITSNQTGFN
ncbi:HET-domain-containing protein [Microthyrium microscopicum]|uniref:HET-domain-containing protein n=1 Tax=Microthyrium microscopicum TaxID=703497 RepID=A0A6A6TUY8_9PEZI|nr:HET-domain-containing protein [Microthyrium microscopicum]